MLKKAIASSLYILCIIVGTFLAFEAWLRIKMYYIKSDPYEIVMFEKVHDRISELWLRGYDDRKYFWGPPYHVYLNRGEDDQRRIEKIHASSILPSGEWHTPNFLRSPKEVEVSSYQVTVNSLGFRSPEFPVDKSEDVYRVIVLGSYPAFGSGVNDDETYSSYLQKKLQKIYPDKKIEVWNGGQQGTTSINGYARLIKEIPKYQPDLLIWDFGWVDLYFGEDFVKDESDQDFEYSLKQRTLQWVWRNLTFAVSSRLIYHFFNADFRKVLLKDWRRLTSKAIAFCKDNGIPVLLLKQRAVIIQDEEYQQFEDPQSGVFFLNVGQQFRDGTLKPTTEMRQEFWEKPNWLTEAGYKQGDEIPDVYYWRVDAIQLNRFALEEVASDITELIKERRL